MRKTVAILLIISLALSLAACGEKSEIKEISCEDIISAYETAGYYVTHGEHNEEAESERLCYIKASLTDDDGSDYIYFITCFSEEGAKEAQKTDKYNIFVWFYAAIGGEWRWLKTGTYGKIEYSYYNSELIKPFRELIK